MHERYKRWINNQTGTLPEKRERVKTDAKAWKALVRDPHGSASQMVHDDFTSCLRQFVLVTPLDAEDVKGIIKYGCTCPEFGQYYVCPHVLAHGISIGEITVPSDRDLATIGRIPRRGRPKRTRGALERQPNDLQGSTHFADVSHPNSACAECYNTHSTNRNPIIYCDTCNLGWHKKCIVPTLDRVPRGEWHCAGCEFDKGEH